jgi:bifunctional DNase/RNase
MLRMSRPLLGCLLLAALALAAGCRPAVAQETRQLHAPADRLLAAELLGVEAVPGTDLALIVIAAGGRQLPMFTGLAEASAILRARDQRRPPRPHTHELLDQALRSAGLKVNRLVVDRLDEAGNFHAAIELLDASGASRWLDCRPSDGIALALRSAARLYVAEEVLEQASQEAAPSTPPIST